MSEAIQDTGLSSECRHEAINAHKGTIHARVLSSPFKMAGVDLCEPAGKSIEHILAKYLATPVYSNYIGAIVELNGEPIAPELWSTTIPAENSLVTVRAWPMGGGGGKDVLRTILSIAVVAAAFWTGGAAAGLLGGFAGYATTAALGAGGLWAVNKLIPFPNVTAQATAKDPQLYSVTASNNTVNRYGVIPRIYGTHRIYPCYGAMPYTEIAGDDQYLRMLFVVGYGPLAISDIKLGETDIGNFDQEHDVRYGYSTDLPQTLYSNEVIEDAQQIELTPSKYVERRTELDCDEASVDISFPSGLAVFDTFGAKFNRTVEFDIEYKKVGDTVWLPSTDPTVEQLCPALSTWTLYGGATYSSGTITFPTAAAYAVSPKIRTRYSPSFIFSANYYSTVASQEFTPSAGYWGKVTFWGAGGFGTTKNSDGVRQAYFWNSYPTSTWTVDSPVLNGGQNVDYVQITLQPTSPEASASFQVKEPTLITSYTTAIIGRTTKMIRRTRHFTFPTAGQYDIRIRRNTAYFTTGTDYPQVTEAAYWTALRSIRQHYPINRTGLCTIALKIKATSQLNGPVDQLNCIATSILPVWNGATWTDTATANPAWAFCDVLRGAAVESQVADVDIDLTAIQTWAGFAAYYGHECNAVFDSRVTRFDALQSIASVGRASFQVLDGKYTVCHDLLPKSTTVQHFTPRNSWDFSGAISCTPVPHAIKARFLNKAQGYLEDTRWIFNDGYDDTNATVIEELFMWGITDADQVWKDGRYHIAVAQLRGSTYTLKCDMEHLVCTRGDLVQVGHDVPMWGLGFGRIKSVAYTAPVTTVVVDAKWPFLSGERHAVRVRREDGTTDYTVVAWSGETGDFDTFTVPADVSALWNAGDLIQFGRTAFTTVECLVQSILPDADLNATLTLVPNELGVYEAETGPIPDHESHVTLPPDTNRYPDAPSVRQIRGDQSVAVWTDTGWRYRIVIDLDPVSSSSLIPRWIEAEWKLHSCDDRLVRIPDASYDSLEVMIDGVEVGETYDINVRYVTEYGRASDWTQATGASGFVVQGDITPPPDVSTLYFDLPSILKWSFPLSPPDLAGFELRFNDGNDSTWSIGTRAFDSLLKATYCDIGTFTGGTKTWMVKAVDTAGNESVNAAFLVREMGDYPTKYVITTYDVQGASFPGTLTGGSRSGGNLVATELTDFWGDIVTESFWGNNDSFDFWGVSYYEAMTYDFTYTPSAGDIPSSLWFTMATTALDYMSYRYSVTDEWRLWPGSIEAQNLPTYFRIATLQGIVEGSVTDLSLELDGDIVEEYFNDVAIASGGTRLAITKVYRAIKTVLVTLQYDGGSAHSWKVDDKVTTIGAGPKIECFTTAAATTAGTIDAQVRGY